MHPAAVLSSFPATHWKPQEENTEILVSYSADPVASSPSLHVEAINQFPVPTTLKNAVGAVKPVPQNGIGTFGSPIVDPDVIDPTWISVPSTGGVSVRRHFVPAALPAFDDEVEVLLFCFDVSSTISSTDDNEKEESSLSGCNPRYI